MMPPDVLAAASRAAPERSPEEGKLVRQFFRNTTAQSAALDQLRTELAAIRKERTDVDTAVATTLIFKEMATPKPSYILNRGEYDQHGAEVTRRTPTMLPPMDPAAPNNRLGLAQWIVSPANPLTARVAVNRFWQQFFGIGLVKTTKDFGTQGEPPSHPELLDWLAVDFMENGWDVKATRPRDGRLGRLPADVAGRRRSCYKRDPENRLLARGAALPTRRRDAARPGALLQRLARRKAGRPEREAAATGRAVGGGRLLTARTPSSSSQTKGTRRSIAARCTRSGSARRRRRR